MPELIIVDIQRKHFNYYPSPSCQLQCHGPDSVSVLTSPAGQLLQIYYKQQPWALGDQPDGLYLDVCLDCRRSIRGVGVRIVFRWQTECCLNALPICKLTFHRTVNSSLLSINSFFPGHTSLGVHEYEDKSVQFYILLLYDEDGGTQRSVV